jgi:hypothetical protein
LAQRQCLNNPLLYTDSFIGTYGISFLLVRVNAALPVLSSDGFSTPAISGVIILKLPLSDYLTGLSLAGLFPLRAPYALKGCSFPNPSPETTGGNDNGPAVKPGAVRIAGNGIDDEWDRATPDLPAEHHPPMRNA